MFTRILRRTLPHATALCLVATGCSAGTTTIPAGAWDGLATDSGSDTASTDTASTDTATSDTGTSDTGTSDTGTADTGTADSASTDTAKTPAFLEVTAIFEQRCVTCHRADALGLPGYAKLPLTTDVAYSKLVGQPANETCGGTLVVPGKSAQSYLYQKITQQTPCEGSRMPIGFEVMPSVPLTAEQLASIQAWIDGGAKP
jgi:cytochrome c5